MIKKQLKSQLLYSLLLPYFLTYFLAHVIEVISNVPKETKKKSMAISGLFTEFCRVTKWKTMMAKLPFLHSVKYWMASSCLCGLSE